MFFLSSPLSSVSLLRHLQLPGWLTSTLNPAKCTQFDELLPLCSNYTVDFGGAHFFYNGGGGGGGVRALVIDLQ